ncbi:MAG: hypothetical protein FJW14_11615 [Acidimicrobiia bacterium]|nr:hypothetical protein [Acidimicrobiia bacterium]
MAGNDERDERLRSLTAMMQRRVHEPELGAEDALLLRQLLDEYTDAVRHVRSASQSIERTLNAAASAAREGRRITRRAHANNAAADAD